MTTDADHGDTGLALEPHLEAALEVIVECILAHGQWPRPRRDTWHSPKQPVIKQFDLADWLLERPQIIEHGELMEYFVLSLQGKAAYDEFATQRERFEKKINAALYAHLEGSELVRAEDERMAEQDQ